MCSCCPIVRQCRVHIAVECCVVTHSCCSTIVSTNQNHILFTDLEIKIHIQFSWYQLCIASNCLSTDRSGKACLCVWCLARCLSVSLAKRPLVPHHSNYCLCNMRSIQIHFRQFLKHKMFCIHKPFPPQCIRTTYNGKGKSSSNSGEESAGQKQLLPLLG